MKTIKQIADEIGVSKQAVWQRIKKQPLSTELQQFTTTKGKTVYMSNDGETLIKREFSASSSIKIDDKQSSMVDDYIDTLKTQITTKDEQIAQYAQQVSNLTIALENATTTTREANALHWQTQQQLSEGDSVHSNEAEATPEMAASAPEEKNKTNLFTRWFGTR